MKIMTLKNHLGFTIVVNYLYHKLAIIAIANLAIIISSSAAINANMNENIAYAQLANNNNNNNNIESVFPDNGPNSDRPPAFLDAYWSENLSANSSVPTNVVKKEVGPGDGISTLAIVLVNRGRSDITGVTGYLDLPAGFKPIAGKNNGTSQSVASFYSVVKAGNTFVLYFDMSVLDQAKVGGYSTLLNLKYSKINQMGQLITSISIPFRLTGRVVLDTTSENLRLIPGSPNQLKVNIHNKGNANATAVVVTITGVTGNSVNSGAGVTSSDGNSVANSNATSSIGQQQQQPSSSSSLSIPTVNLASQTFNIGDIPANSTVQLSPTVYPVSSAGETAQNLNLQISYGDAYGNQKTSNSQIGLVIAPNPPQSVLNLTNNNNGSALILTAGKIQNMGFTLENNDKRPITNVVASLNSESDSMKILGDSRWTVQSMLPQSKLNLSTKVFASSNIIGQPAVFTLTVQYVSAGQSKTDSLNLGAYIAGEIKIRVYDVHINNIGNVPNLVGNLLNEGNTVGLFTTIQIVNDQQLRSLADFMTSLPPPQYLGDLQPDSPLPFSIPLNVDNGISPGTYPVSLKITYSDDLKNTHELILNKILNVKPQHRQQRTNDQGLTLFGIGGSSNSRGAGDSRIFGIPLLVIIIIAIIAAVAIALILIIRRRRRSRSASLGMSENDRLVDDNNEDIESLIDDYQHSDDKKRHDTNSIGGKRHGT